MPELRVFGCAQGLNSGRAKLILDHFTPADVHRVIQGIVRRVQREQLSTALPWAVRVLGLPPLDPPAGAR
jgi:hypothetical protein